MTATNVTYERKQAANGRVDKASNGGTREHIVEDIIRRLYSNELAPGHRLQEPQLAAEYDVSRGPIREALYALAAMGVVEIKAQKGAQIRVLSLEEAIDALLVSQQLAGFAARTAAMEDYDTPQGHRFAAFIDRLSEFPADADTNQTSDLREEFFDVLTALANNKELRRILSAVQIHLIRTQYNFLLREIDPFRVSDYRRIGSAVLAKEPRKAETLARAHIERAIKKLRAFGAPD
ncbi:GntR family transcriptional regulator [Novosphingobium marinum]|uniref:DNA-binding GntR family transcriptional regulator n=1 Tax=Novosphingobium marinum TaxID=1514948 RepID=A0A7Z0BW74_9SPHN|nr:GntR family transcriptional regulator [Novosphingobium marinum]NYH97038.1 DNA-binding GntR family transcriptional regulator [Novosphingobium marinum]GGC43072.1 GntR family transcriptional regulator [Novosphingobium marinum]